jgi:SAM-dependent methyltransferase
MANRVCPWWMGPLLLNPLRRWSLKPEKLLAPYVREGMIVLEPGPGMGFFTIPMARLVGAACKVIAVDIQPKMLDKLKLRAGDAGFADRVDLRLARPDSLQIIDLFGTVDFVLAFAMVHETPSAENFFRETVNALRPDGALLLVEPSGHVNSERFLAEIRAAQAAGLEIGATPEIARSHAALLRKPAAR